jgi:hypothetical protein
MNVAEARVVLRERSMLDVVDLALRFLVEHARAYAVTFALVAPVPVAITLGLARVAGWGWAWTSSLALSPLAAAPFTALASRLLFESQVRPKDALAAATRALPALLGARTLCGIALVVGGLFFVLPAMWIWATFFYVNEVIVLERATVSTSLGRLQRLLSGQGGDTLMALLFLTALHILAVVLADVAGRSVLEDVLEVTPPASILQGQGSALGLLGFWFFVPLAATCRFLLYINGRTRTEGWDVQTRFAALATREASANDEGRLSGVDRAARGADSPSPGAEAQARGAA